MYCMHSSGSLKLEQYREDWAGVVAQCQQANVYIHKVWLVSLFNVHAVSNSVSN